MGLLLAGTSAAFGHITGRLHISERDKTDTGFIEKANNVGTAQNGTHIKPAKHSESQYRKKAECQRYEETERRDNKRAGNG